MEVTAQLRGIKVVETFSRNDIVVSALESTSGQVLCYPLGSHQYSSRLCDGKVRAMYVALENW